MADSIKVIVRVRPFKQNQLKADQQNIIDMQGQTVYITNPANKQQSPKQFGFHRCYWSFDESKGVRITNKEVFADIGKEVLQSMYSGYNSTIFAYGQTGSGKSCSVEGVPGIEPKGLLQQCLQDVFVKKQTNKKNGISTIVKATYMEIYNEKLKNLLSKDPKNNQVQMKQLTATDVKYYAKSADGKTSSELKPELCQTYQQIQKLFYQGKSFRVVGATDMNKNSSRSHAIFTIYYQEKGPGKQINSKFNIVDLAGSQRLQRTNATGDRAKQGTAINKSLSALGRVIGILADNCTKGKKEFVPYRQSVLTQILAQSLGGNSKTFLIAALSPAAFNYDQTLSTLRFAQNASKISTQSKKNVQVKGSDKQLKAQIQRLRRQLQQAKKNQTIIQQAPQKQMVYMNNMQVIQIQDQNKVLFLQQQIKKLRDVMKSKQQIQKQLEEQRKRKKQLQVSRDQALKKAGLTINGAQEDNKLPYIINISDDPTIAGLLIYKLKQGETAIGTGEVEENHIKLNALGINKKHCSIIQQKGKFYILPKADSKVFVNGFQVTEKQQIHHLDRITLGHANKFKLVIPGAKAKDDLRTTNAMEDKYGEFLSDKLNGKTQQVNNLKQLIQTMQKNLDKNAFYRFLQTLQNVYSDVDQANQYTLERYKKYPLRSRNLQFNFNFMTNIKGEAQVVIICSHKQSQQVLFLWNLDKFKSRLAQMQQWWSQSKNPQKSYEEFDPWFDASDDFIKEKQKLGIMSLKQMRDFYSRKQQVLEQKVKQINTEQVAIMNSLIQHFEPGITKQGLQDVFEQYCDYYFRQDEKFINKKNLQKIQQMRKNEQTHTKMKRWMETITQFEQSRKQFQFCNKQIVKFNTKKKKGQEEAVGGGNEESSKLKKENQQLKKQLKQASSQKQISSGGGNQQDKKTIQDQYKKIEQLQQQLKRRALEMKKLKH